MTIGNRPGWQPEVAAIAARSAATANLDGADAARILAMLAETDALTQTRSECKQRIATARAALERVPDSQAKTALLAVADATVARQS